MSVLSLSDAVLRVAATNPFEGAVEQLATAVRLGALARGDVLPPERELAERLGVSRETLREAIAALRDAGMVATTRGRGGGTVVVYDGPQIARQRPSTTIPGRRGAALADALEFRRVVEPGAAALAARQLLSPDQRAWLTDALRETAAATEPAVHRLADSRLHLAIATLSGSPMLVEAVTRAQAPLHELLVAIPVLPRNIAHSDAQHELVVTAVLHGDPDSARRVMEEHCDATSALLRGLLG